MPTISIITACYNAADTLKQCLDSVASQSFRDYEHIVVDGGSDDESVDLLRSHISQNLHWISESDSGIAEAMNKGIRRAKGKWLLFLHADDQFKDNKILKIASSCLEDKFDIVAYPVELQSRTQGKTIIDNAGWTFKTNFKTTLGHQGAFIRGELFQTLGYYDESFKIAMDYEWFMRAFHQRVAILLLPGILSIMSADGISSRKDWSSLSERFQEERRVHKKHAQNCFWKSIYLLYWSIYPTYRRLKTHLLNGPKQSTE